MLHVAARKWIGLIILLLCADVDGDNRFVERVKVKQFTEKEATNVIQTVSFDVLFFRCLYKRIFSFYH